MNRTSLQQEIKRTKFMSREREGDRDKEIERKRERERERANIVMNRTSL